MPRVKLHRPTSPDDRPLKPQDEFEAGLFPEIAPEPAQPEKPKYEAWPDYVPEEVPHERTSYLPNIRAAATSAPRASSAFRRTRCATGRGSTGKGSSVPRRMLRISLKESSRKRRLQRTTSFISRTSCFPGSPEALRRRHNSSPIIPGVLRNAREDKGTPSCPSTFTN